MLLDTAFDAGLISVASLTFSICLHSFTPSVKDAPVAIRIHFGQELWNPWLELLTGLPAEELNHLGLLKKKC